MTTANKKVLRDVDRAVLQSVMFAQGILPMETVTLDMRRALNQLPLNEARMLARKFRKLWRKAMRAKEESNPIGHAHVRTQLGVGNQQHSREELNARKKLVFDQLWRDHVAPLLRNFERGGT